MAQAHNFILCTLTGSVSWIDFQFPSINSYSCHKMDPQLFRLQLGCFTGSLLQNILQDDLEICSTKSAMLDWSIVDMEMMAYV
jgi:hypothetical protein